MYSWCAPAACLRPPGLTARVPLVDILLLGSLFIAFMVVSVFFSVHVSLVFAVVRTTPMWGVTISSK